MSIKNNTTSLQELLEAVNNLPDRQSGGINLPELTNKGLAEDLMLGKKLIDDKGKVITGTFTIDNELSTQDDLIAQIQAMVDSLPEAGNNEDDSFGNLETCTVMATSYSGGTQYIANVFNNGKSEIFISNITSPETTTTIENVITGSIFLIVIDASGDQMYSGSNGFESYGVYGKNRILKVTSTSGETASITTHPI